ncbi:FUSC family protein [Streptomyces wuyuanensis]|uniref:Aromatic acid exporter family member 1 n=1 Tax=Streptomyces wuyuanensis TaxID=1196353 RepID=A0A1G9T581_9ACTN|nr:FUSC family protein [Streptomyces wuyuanensis]SDM42782.1 Aromatic acid exporter family member 1 [Streptomyces wuyuanensis]
MAATSEPLRDLVRRHREPAVVQTVRSTAAAVVSYVIALQLSGEALPLTAPLTALLVVQVTLYSTLTTGIRRVNSVVAGVLIAIGFSALVGLSWWSLGLVILASLVIGRFVKVGEFVPEVAISAMLVLGVTQVTETGWDRVLETLIGAVVGLLFNVLFVPPVWVSDASAAITDLSGRMRGLLVHIAEELGEHTPVAQAAARLHEARRLDHDIVQVDAALRQAEDSLRLNPRVKEPVLSRVVLRTGLDALEICAVILRVSCRTLTDLAKTQPDGTIFPPAVTTGLQDLFGHLSDAIGAFTSLITTQMSVTGADAETRLSEELAQGRACRDRVAAMMLEDLRKDQRNWQLHGALLAEADRILDELDVEKRSERLIEELDRHARERLSSRKWLDDVKVRIRRSVGRNGD